MRSSLPSIHICAALTDQAKALRDHYLETYTSVPLEKAEVIVALGGDGFMLEALHKTKDLKKPIYGIHCGHVGFLMNRQPDDLKQALAKSVSHALPLLKMIAQTGDGKVHEYYAMNEVSLMRQTSQATKIRIDINDQTRLAELISDGILLATPAGSTAYNLSAHGPILPLSAHLLALTPICAFRPRRWRGALLPNTVRVVLTILEQEKRPVSASADSHEVRDVQQVIIQQEPDMTMTLLFDPQTHPEERILQEQFF